MFSPFGASAGQFSRHIKRRYFKMRELVACTQVKLVLVGTDHNPADLFTKVLQREKFQRFHRRVTNPLGHVEPASLFAKSVAARILLMPLRILDERDVIASGARSDSDAYYRMGSLCVCSRDHY